MRGGLLEAIERYCAERKISVSRFGRQLCGDPRFVFDLRRGREPRADMVTKVCDLMQESAGMRILYLLKNRPKVVFYAGEGGQIAALFRDGDVTKAVVADRATMNAVRLLLDPKCVSDLAV